MGPVIVVGAGCFGAWTAYWLARSGHDVTLLDAHGPGNSRASSGGETRVIRIGSGAEEIYTRVAEGGAIDERFRLATKEKVQQRTVY